MSVDLSLAEARARRAYEAGRRSLASWIALPLALIGVVAVCFGTHVVFGALAGAAIVAVSWLAIWRGRVAATAVLPGVVAGFVPLACAFAAQSYGHVCTGSQCYSLCMPACTTGGVIAGLLIARLGRNVRARGTFFGVAAAIAALEGSLGCSCVGFGGVIGLGVGLGIVLLAALARRHVQRNQRS